MTPRRRTIPDAAILAATRRVVARVGPAHLTLAAVAREAGLAPATLIQRFGSKRGLLLALADTAVERVAARFEAVRSAGRSPLTALVDVATEAARRAASAPEELAGSLAFLQLDVTDPDLRRLAVERSRRLDAGYQSLLDEAVSAGELRRCNTARLARAVGALSTGSLIGWVTAQKGSARQRIKNDLTMLLAPYRPAAAPRRAKARKRRPAPRRR